MKIVIELGSNDYGDTVIRAIMQFQADENVVGPMLPYELDSLAFCDFHIGDITEFEQHFRSLAQYNGIAFDTCDCVAEYIGWTNRDKELA